MKKRVQAWILALVMLFTTVAIPLADAASVQAAENELKLQIHYLREDGNYDGWDIFAWDGISGGEFQKDGDAYVVDEDGVVYEATVGAGSTNVGFIVRYGGDTWADREWVDEEKKSGDRNIDVSGYVSGTIHAYVVSGEIGTVVDFSQAVKPEIETLKKELNIQFHYDREDKNYGAWELYTWDSLGNPGYEVQFDAEGVANVKVPDGSTTQGFIIKEDGTWNKDWDGDRFVKTEGYVAGTIHVYVFAGVEDFEVDYSEAVENKLYINFHYSRNDKDYGTWELYTWDSLGNPGYEVQFDANGIAKVEVPGGSTKQGFIVKKDGTWDKDWGGDRFVNTDGFIAGTIDVYVTEATEGVSVEYKNAVKGTYVAPEEPEVPEEDNLTITFHYLRADGNYDGWNVAAWDGASGATFEKDDNGYVTDKHGAVAISEVTPGSTKIGFIVRYSVEGNDWAAKDWDGDRFVEIKDYVSGTIHVYVTSGQEAIVVDYSDAKKAPLKITFFLDKKKNDANWGLWLWDDIGTEAIYPLFKENADGKLQITYEVASGATWVGFIVRDDNWQKDPDGDRTVDVSKYVGGEIVVNLTSGSADYTPDYTNAIEGAKITKAVYEGSNVVITTSMALADPENELTVWCENEQVEIKAVEKVAENVYHISFTKELDRAKAYVVKFNGNTFKVTMPSLYKDEVWVKENTYTGDDLGATWTKDKTVFKVWAPLASEVSVNLYEKGNGGEKLETFAMEKTANGVWAAAVSGNLNGVYYTYTVNNSGEIKEACDPYAKTTGLNGDRAMVIDMASTNPEGWENDENPNADLEFTDIVLYELHVRDASIDASSSVSDANKGNFLGLTEHGKNTILDHMVDLGITHVHLLPIYDFSSVDEATDGFNWGYDPKNYNVPEGSYSSDPYNGEVRVKEMKEMVQTLHENGISVVMDVVYNHVADAGNYCFNKIVPNYFSRMNENGGYSSNSGCGNDTASEHVMVRKYIVESVKYWADEYHIDGFRFDLVGLIDTVTINEIMKEVWSDHPDVVFYGEGWAMNSYDTGVSMTEQSNADEVPGFAFFNDTFRDSIKGSVWDEGPGYVSGKTGLLETVMQSFLGASVWGSESSVCPSPLQTINYTSCHDNNTLYDRLKMSRPDASEEDIIKMNNLAAAITLTSQGVPFIHAAEDFLRSKPLPDGGYDHNSYASGDAINSIKWNTLEKNINVYEYYKGLIAFRKAHGALRLTSAADVTANITTMTGLDENVAGFVIKGGVNGEKAESIVVIFNPNAAATKVVLPEGEWNIYVNAEKAGTTVLGTATGTTEVAAISAMVLVKEAKEVVEPEQPEKPEEPSTPVVPEKGEEITKEDVEIAEDNKTSEVVTENNKEYVVLGNEAMEDISIKGEKDVLPEDAFFVRKYLEKGEKYDTAKKAVEEELKDVAEYKAIEIDLYAGDGKTVTKLDGYVYITIPVPTDIKVAEGNVLAVYRVNDDGSLVNCAAEVKDGKITFRTNHFSTFVIVEQAKASVLPVTGDNSASGLYFFILLAGAAFAMTGIASLKKRIR